MSKKPTVNYTANTKAANFYVGTATPTVFDSAIGSLKVEPPPPPRWAASFKVRSLTVTMNSSNKNRDKALLEMSQMLYGMLKEPWGISLDSMYRL